jgi:hypothetical protein
VVVDTETSDDEAEVTDSEGGFRKGKEQNGVGPPRSVALCVVHEAFAGNRSHPSHPVPST